MPRFVKWLLVCCVFNILAVVAFFVGLVPGECVLLSPGDDSYILIGIARFALMITGFCEFVLGAGFVAIWIHWSRKHRKT